MIPWIIISIVILLILGIVIAVLAYKKKGRHQGTDYYTFFIIGLVWTLFGIYEQIRNSHSVFLALGIVFMAIGYAHKNKWKQNHLPFNKIEKNKKLLVIITIIGLLVLVVAALAVFILKA